MSELTLNFNDQSITINTHEIEGKTLYKAQDLLKGYGMDTKETKACIRNWLKSKELKGSIMAPFTIKGRNGGTYITKRQCLKLAGYISEDFEDAVYDAFDLLLQGKEQQAAIVANDHVITQDLLNRFDLAEKHLFNFEIVDKYLTNCGYTGDFKRNNHWNIGVTGLRKLIAKASFGRTPKQITNKTCNLKEWVLKQDHGKGMQTMVYHMEMARSLILQGADRLTIASTLNVEATGKVPNPKGGKWVECSNTELLEKIGISYVSLKDGERVYPTIH